MARSRWLGVFVGLAWTGLAWCQPGPAPTQPGEGGTRFLTVQELDRPAQRCRIIKSWRQPDGSRAFQVESLNGGGMMTIAEAAAPKGPPSPGAPQALKTRIFHWGPGNMPPAEAPVPPPGEDTGRLIPRPAPTAAPATTAPAAGRSGFWPPAYAGQKLTPFHTTDPAGPVSSKQTPTAPKPSSGPHLTPSPSPATPRMVVAHPAINTRDPAIPPQPGRLVAQKTASPQSPYQPSTGPATPLPQAAGSTPAIAFAPPASPYSVVQRPAAAPFQAGTAPPPTTSSYNVLPTPGSTCAVCQGSGGWNNRPGNGGCCGSPTCESGCCPIKKRSLCDRLFCRRKELAPMRTACGELIIPVPMPPEAGSCVTCAPVPKPRVVASCPAPEPVCCCPPPCAPCSSCPIQPPCMVEEKPRLRERFMARRHEEKPVPVTAAGERIIEVPSGEAGTVVTMPVAPEKPPRPSLWSRLRRPAPPPNTLIPGAETLPPPQAPVVKAPVEPAQPGDFRESWGKADPHQPTPIAKSDLTPPSRAQVADPRAVQAPTPAPLPGAVATQATPVRPPYTVGVPVEEGNAFSDAPPKPAAKPDGNQPPNTANAFGDGSGNGNGNASGAPASGQQGGSSPHPVMMTPPPPPLVLDPREPHDMHNAFTLAATTRRMIPADAGSLPIIPNAFSPGSNGNGFSIMPSLMPPAPVGQQSASGQQQPATGQQPASRPAIDARQVAMSRYGAQGAGAPPAALERPVAVPPEQSQSEQWLVSLKDSVYPSEREWAAERLGRLDWHAEPRIIDALVKAAREDVAPTVRAACVRTLARMKVKSPLVLTQVRALQDDSDARVRQEVEQALGILLTEPARRPE